MPPSPPLPSFRGGAGVLTNSLGAGAAGGGSVVEVSVFTEAELDGWLDVEKHLRRAEQDISAAWLLLAGGGAKKSVLTELRRSQRGVVNTMKGLVHIDRKSKKGAMSDEGDQRHSQSSGNELDQAASLDGND